MKKLLSILLVCLCCIGLAGCTSPAEQAEQPQVQTQAEQQPKQSVTVEPEEQKDPVLSETDLSDEKTGDGTDEALSEETTAPDSGTVSQNATSAAENVGQPTEAVDDEVKPVQDEAGPPAGNESAQPAENQPAAQDHQGSTSVTVPAAEETEGDLVWVPTNGGTKYHSKAGCSNMKNPMQVSVETAIANGYEPCKKCYK